MPFLPVGAVMSNSAQCTRIDAMHLKCALRKIEAYRGDVSIAALLRPSAGYPAEGWRLAHVIGGFPIGPRKERTGRLLKPLIGDNRNPASVVTWHINSSEQLSAQDRSPCFSPASLEAARNPACRLERKTDWTTTRDRNHPRPASQPRSFVATSAGKLTTH